MALAVTRPTARCGRIWCYSGLAACSDNAYQRQTNQCQHQSLGRTKLALVAPTTSAPGTFCTWARISRTSLRNAWVLLQAHAAH